MSHRALNEGPAKPVEIDGNSDRQVLAVDQSSEKETGELRTENDAMTLGEVVALRTSPNRRNKTCREDGTHLLNR